MKLSPEERKVLESLVLEFGLGTFASGADLKARLSLRPTELNDAVDELELKGLVHVQRTLQKSPYTFQRVAPKARAWRFIDPQLLGFDPEEDKRLVAQCVEDQQRVSREVLARDTQLPEERLDIAALSLESDMIIRVKPLGGYRFGWAVATPRTGPWLREQQED